MAESTSPADDANEPKAFEWWMTSMFAMGAGFSAFVSLLIPPFVTQVTGEASAAGIVMAIISLGAVLGPAFGTFADKHRAHRLVLVLGVAGMAVAFVMYALSAESAALYALDAILMGASIAAVGALAPVFIIGARLSQAVEARQMTTLQLMQPAGQVAGGVLLSLAAQARWSFPARFWLAAIFMTACFVVTWFSTRGLDRRLAITTGARSGGRADDAGSTSLRSVFVSLFGVYLVVLTLSSVANNGINNQISNIMPNVYGISEAMTSTLISIAGVLNIGLFFVAGRWMARRGPWSPFLAALVIRLVAALGMAVVGLIADAPALLAAGFMQLLYQSNPFSRLTQAPVAVRFATFPAGAASGWVMAASATGSFGGSVGGGFLAESLGFNAINWMAVVASGLAVVVALLVLAPAMRRNAAPPPDGAVDHDLNPAAA